jgi:hypothetical protein
MKFKILILLLFASIISKAQYYNIVTLTNNNGKIQAINPLGKQAFELNCKDLIWYEQPDTKIVIRDYQNPGTSLCVLANNALTTPLFSNIKDSLRIWQLRCGPSTNSQATIGFDTTQTDTSLIQSIQLSQIIDSLGVLSNKLQFIYKLDTTNVDTSLVDYLVQFENLKDSLNVIINKLEYIYKLDTSQIDTSLINYIAQFDRQNDSLSKIIDLLKNIKDTSNQAILEQIRLNISDSLRTSFYVNNDSIKVYVLNNYIDSTYYVLIDSIVKLLQKDTFIVKFTDSTYYTQLDSIKYYLSQNDSIEVCFDTITFNTNVVNLPIVNCNGDSAVRVQVCNIDTSINVKVDTTNSILYRIENKNITDTTHTAILREISDTLTHLAEILNELKSDCIGSNETYYINGTNSVTINASEVCSYTITVIGGDVDFSENGVSSPFSFPNGYTGSSSFKNGTKFLINQITFTGTNGSSKAIIKIIK